MYTLKFESKHADTALEYIKYLEELPPVCGFLSKEEIKYKRYMFMPYFDNVEWKNFKNEILRYHDDMYNFRIAFRDKEDAATFKFLYHTL